MALEIFDFPYHQASVAYPERSAQVKLGGNYLFSTKPSGPAMRSFTLEFPLMYWYQNNLGVFDPLIEPKLNLMRLDQFYLRHELHADFVYHHQIYGSLVVKFAKPLVIPTAKTNGNGAVFGLSLSVIEQPV